MALTDRQERFCKEYIIDCNATQAAIRAGYSTKRANQAGSALLTNRKVSERISELMAEKDAALIASGDEVLTYLSRVMRGEIGEEAIDAEGERVQLAAKISDRNRAAELLGKRWALWTERVAVESDAPTLIFDFPRDAPTEGTTDG